MPKARSKSVTSEDKEKWKESWFVSLYIKAGATESKIAACEKRAKLEPGTGAKILKRKSAQAEIALRTMPLKMEEVRQRTIGEAVSVATKVYQEQLAQRLEIIKCHKLEMPVLLGRLMEGVVGIDINTWPKEVLEYIKTAMVVEGAIQSGNLKRLSPADNLQDNPAASVYTSLFNRLPAAGSSEPDQPESGVYDLYPQTSAPIIPKSNSLPLPGESIEEPPPEKPSNPNVITVEVG